MPCWHLDLKSAGLSYVTESVNVQAATIVVIQSIVNKRDTRHSSEFWLRAYVVGIAPLSQYNTAFFWFSSYQSKETVHHNMCIRAYILTSGEHS